MQKIFVNKNTDMVEQILEIREGEVIPDDYFSSCYAVIDEQDKIKGYNLKYNKDLKNFEVVEGIPAKEEIIIIKQPTAEEIQEIKKENEDLKARMEKLEELLNVR